MGGSGQDDDRGRHDHGQRADDRERAHQGRLQITGTKAFLTEQGLRQNHGRGWGDLERFSAASLHVGFTLLVFAEPWLVLATIVVHSATNMLAVRYAKRSIARTELAVLVVAVAVLAAGIVISS